jgi:hypothetical protein
MRGARPIRGAAPLLVVVAMLLPAVAGRADDTASSTKPVKAIADRMLTVKTARGEGPLPLYVYVGDANFNATEQRYMRRDVIYLLGTLDIDPNHPALDKTCAAEDEGPYRFFRGKAYFRYLETRHPDLATTAATQQLWYVPGVEHDGDKMLNSQCGLEALFGSSGCATRVLEPKP